MEEFAAERFCNIASQLAGLATHHMTITARATLPPQQKQYLANRLEEVALNCDAIGLKVTALHIRKVVDRIVPLDFEGVQVSEKLTGIGITLTSEMSTHLFMRIFDDRVPFYEEPTLFGQAVNDHFPSAARDIKAAGSCFATDRNTACVMHLMRVLELGMNVLASKLQVDFQRRNWENVLNDIDAAVKKINGPHAGTDWKEQQRFYSEAAKDFRYFKDAWRNHAMHFHEHYEAAEARSILDHVKTFMEHLAANGLREK